MRVSSIHVRALVEAVEAGGTDCGALLRGAGLTTESLGDAYGWVDEDQLDRLMVLATEHTGDPAFGLRWGEQSPMMRYDLMAMMAGAHASTLRETLECLRRFQPLLGDKTEFTFIDNGAGLTLRFDPLGTSLVGRRVRAEFVTSGFSRFIRYACSGSTEVVHHVRFDYPRPAHAVAYERVFGHTVRFSQSFTAFEIDREWLDRPLQNSNAELHAVLVGQAEQVLARLVHGESYAERLRRLIGAALPNLPDMRQVAKSLGMSERSLRRRLADEDTSFSRIAQEARCVIAQRLLADHDRSVQQVAFDAGFESPTAFHRAFRRWTGKSPLEFRSERRA